MKLVTVNNLIQLYNTDIERAKELEKKNTKVKETKSSVKRAEELIKKVGE